VGLTGFRYSDLEDEPVSPWMIVSEGFHTGGLEETYCGVGLGGGNARSKRRASWSDIQATRSKRLTARQTARLADRSGGVREGE